MDEPDVNQSDRSDPGTYQTTSTEVRFKLSSDEYLQLQKIAHQEQATVHELARRIVVQRIAPLSSSASRSLAKKRGAIEERRRPYSPPTRQSPRISYAPLVAVILLFLAGILILLLYAGAKELGLFGDATRSAPPATADHGTEPKPKVIVTVTPTVTPTRTPTATTTPAGMPNSSSTPASNRMVTPPPTLQGKQSTSPPSTTSSALITSPSVTAVVPISTTIVIVTWREQSLAELVEQAGQDVDAVLQISRTIKLLPNQPLTLTVGVRSSRQPGQDGRRYVFPVYPPEVAKFERGHHDYPATDIFAPKRTVVVAVTDGAIYEMSRTDTWDPTMDDPATRGGISLSIVGSDGWRYYYSHMGELRQDLSPGDRVVVGEILGYTGDSGNARGVPQLHFGISKPTFPGDWQVRRGQVLPYAYLQAWLLQENKIPTLSK
jgi:hypothetical protein